MTNIDYCLKWQAIIAFKSPFIYQVIDIINKINNIIFHVGACVHV
ncbi:hypothetical protein [Psychrobacter sp. van23A]|nr:hypothetical protein [Psychrobacter sp. van23A]WLW65234.1 hypothetical protein RAH45_07105 [Psychrobacter sp. van23A]